MRGYHHRRYIKQTSYIALLIAAIAPLTTTLNSEANAFTAQSTQAEAAQISRPSPNEVNPPKTDPQAEDNLTLKIRILRKSPGFLELLRDYSTNPHDDLTKLAGVLTLEQTRDFVEKTRGKRFRVSPDEAVEISLVDDNGVHFRSARNKCWKGYVGIAAYTTVSAFYCGLTGPGAPLCGIGAAIAGDNVDWHKNC